MERYRHTQRNALIAVLVIVSITGGTIVAAFALSRSGADAITPRAAAVIVIWACSLSLLVAGSFATLTVRLDESALYIRFGPLPFIRRAFALGDVESAAPVTSPWYYGYGVHWFPGGTVYNVSGRWSVELLLRSGRRVRIGTDEPEALADAINKMLSERRR